VYAVAATRQQPAIMSCVLCMADPTYISNVQGDDIMARACARTKHNAHMHGSSVHLPGTAAAVSGLATAPPPAPASPQAWACRHITGGLLQTGHSQDDGD
jgi:hypothetical protein